MAGDSCRIGLSKRRTPGGHGAGSSEFLLAARKDIVRAENPTAQAGLQRRYLL
jgi:hypothetical protein